VFGECIPKLKAEGVGITWDTETWILFIPQYAGDPKSWRNADFYLALDALLAAREAE
jgi:hypothetical protein